MEIQQGICILCLEKCNNSNAIAGNTKNILDVLLPKIDFTVIQEPVICKNCEEMLIKYLHFKATCTNTQKCLVPFLNKEDEVHLNLKDIYHSKMITGTGVPEDLDVCGFCMGLVKNCSTVSLDVEEGDVMLQKMINQCLPELDVSTMKKRIICAACRGSLEDCFHFVTNCLIIGEKIKKYCEADINNKGQIELRSLLELTIKDVTTREIDGNSTDTIKKEEQFCEDIKNPDEKEMDDNVDKVKLEQISFEDTDDAIQDIENKNVMETKPDVNNEQQFTPKNMYACKEESNTLGSIKVEDIFSEENETKYKEQNLIEMEDQKCLLNEEVEIKTDERDFNRSEDDIGSSKSEVVGRMPRRDECSVLNLERDQSKLFIKNTVTNEQASKIRMYQCKLCLFQTKYKNVHIKHLLKHKDPSEITLYNCDTCSFQTKNKYNLKNHLVVHKDPTEVTMYTCNSCTFQSKFKGSIKKHSLKHKYLSEVAVYTCDTCSYQTHLKYNLKKHSLVHKDPSEVTMHKCNICTFQTKLKGSLKKHLLRHKDPLDVTLYNCDACSYQTTQKDDLQDHLLRHKDHSETAKHTCNSCSYESKFRCFLKTDMIKLKNPSEEAMYKCDNCSFQTKCKLSL